MKKEPCLQQPCLSLAPIGPRAKGTHRQGRRQPVARHSFVAVFEAFPKLEGRMTALATFFFDKEREQFLRISATEEEKLPVIHQDAQHSPKVREEDNGPAIILK